MEKEMSHTLPLQICKILDVISITNSCAHGQESEQLFYGLAVCSALLWLLRFPKCSRFLPA